MLDPRFLHTKRANCNRLFVWLPLHNTGVNLFCALTTSRFYKQANELLLCDSLFLGQKGGMVCLFSELVTDHSLTIPTLIQGKPATALIKFDPPFVKLLTEVNQYY